MSRLNTVAIIQARMGSTRLPGKAMLSMKGQSILSYLIERISRSRTLDSIVVATTMRPQDCIIVDECEHLGIAWFRGSETDVLGRYYAAAAITNADIVVRVTADNPFTDPDSIDRVVENIQVSGSDYAIEMNLPIGTTGEALTWQALEFINSEAHTPQWREHVTLYAKENPQAMKCAFLTPRPGCDRPDLRFTVDHLADYKYVRNISQKLPNTDFGLMNLIRIADDMSEAKRVYA